MKKIITFLLIGIFVFSIFGCQEKKESSAINYVVLEGNPSTGYEWKVEVEDESIAKLSDTSFNQEKGEQEALGAGGEYTFTFEGLKEGSTVVTFDYKKDWESKESERREIYSITVDKDLNVNLAQTCNCD